MFFSSLYRTFLLHPFLPIRFICKSLIIEIYIIPCLRMLNTRRKAILWLLFISVFICFMAASAGYWFHWTVVATSFFMWFILDLMFFDDSQFIYEPDYRSVTVAAFIFLAWCLSLNPRSVATAQVCLISFLFSSLSTELGKTKSAARNSSRLRLFSSILGWSLAS